jgi:hypothetical protein
MSVSQCTLSLTPLGRYDSDLETDLADLVRVEIGRRFADHRPEIGEGDLVATFECPSRSLGDVVVWVEDDGVIVGVVDMWHGHFDEGTDEEIVAECADFLDDLFNDKVVIWVARRDGRALGGGSSNLDAPAPPSGRIDRRMSREADEVRAATWSAPGWTTGSMRTRRLRSPTWVESRSRVASLTNVRSSARALAWQRSRRRRSGMSS